MNTESQENTGKFAYNKKSHILSSMLVKPSLENEAEDFKSRTLEVPREKYDGTWNFQGYFPRKCKQEPSCHMDKITFKWDKEKSNEWFSLKTSANKAGETCTVSEKKMQSYGKTWI